MLEVSDLQSAYLRVLLIRIADHPIDRSANSRPGTCGPTSPDHRQAADAVAVSTPLERVWLFLRERFLSHRLLEATMRSLVPAAKHGTR